MEDHERNSHELKSREQLWKELFSLIEKQLETNTKLKEIVEPIVSAESKKGVTLTEEQANEAIDLFVELEALQAQERPIYHRLLGAED